MVVNRVLPIPIIVIVVVGSSYGRLSWSDVSGSKRNVLRTWLLTVYSPVVLLLLLWNVNKSWCNWKQSSYLYQWIEEISWKNTFVKSKQHTYGILQRHSLPLEGRMPRRLKASGLRMGHSMARTSLLLMASMPPMDCHEIFSRLTQPKPCFNPDQIGSFNPRNNKW